MPSNIIMNFSKGWSKGCIQNRIYIRTCPASNTFVTDNF